MKLLSLFVACLFVTGCKNPTKDFQGLADRACECAENDTACGNKVLADLTAFAADHKAPGTSDFNAAGVKIDRCLNEAGVEPRQLTAALEKLDH